MFPFYYTRLSQYFKTQISDLVRMLYDWVCPWPGIILMVIFINVTLPTGEVSSFYGNMEKSVRVEADTSNREKFITATNFSAASTIYTLRQGSSKVSCHFLISFFFFSLSCSSFLCCLLTTNDEANIFLPVSVISVSSTHCSHACLYEVNNFNNGPTAIL